jgi:hypothetical protein
MGSPTIVADIQSPGPTSEVAARLLDVDASGNETLVARGLYRSEVDLAATRQVFQLHPCGWKFAAGHVAKLELLPADQPYGRNANGQSAVTVSNLELRLPVLEPPDCALVLDPAPKVVPTGYALAADYATTPPTVCSTTSTTTTTPPSTTTTTTASTTTTTGIGTTSTTTTAPATTTTTTLPVSPLHLTVAVVSAESGPGAANGTLRLAGTFTTPPAFGFPPDIGVRVDDAATLHAAHAFGTCSSTGGHVRCADQDAPAVFRADFLPLRRTPGQVRFKVSFRRVAVDGPFTTPITMTLTDDAAVVRTDHIDACRSSGRRASCRER